MKWKNLIIKGLVFAIIFGFSSTIYAQSENLSREEIALKKAEDRLESYRLKLVDIKRDIETADSLFVAGEELEKDGVVRKAEARDEMKAIEKGYKSDSKPAKKMEKNKDRSVSAEGRAQLKEITATYKTNLKEAESKLKAAEKDIVTAGRMMDKADKKLDLLKSKLKAAEKSYEDAEKALNEKRENKE